MTGPHVSNQSSVMQKMKGTTLLLMMMMMMKMMMMMIQVIQRIDDECMRSRKFLNPSSYAKVTHECQQRMIADHLQFLHGECRAMVHKEKRHGLSA